ncbi:MAG: prepilin-type N-terminal cleavage/methylation domain-containing protein [Mariprofundaceae bacterium]|nr:prepilin-type N-terminal cleavage/methylation domain-containing protein [Mariprofundaceae bacterium]
MSAQHAESGFTLLEILLVIVIVAVTAAMVVPSISLVGMGSVQDEAKRLRLTMRLAMEESQLSGQPLRWLATEHTWSFEVFSLDDGKWSAFEEPPLSTYQLPQGVRIMSVQQAGDFALDMVVEREGADDAPIVGMVLLLPDGTTSQSNVRLEGEGDGDDEVRQLQIRPGPAGIRLKALEP